MSKMDALRAMREARHAETIKRATRAKPTLRLVSPSATPKDASADAGPAGSPAVEPVPELPAPALCGHRAISGKTCTRELGHTAKSHRYS
ncbi:hypothetical protein [Nocardioides sp. InS609-2]|uniref:hypothetical protein n=1 Tax=Nocardioides sp. InS609-2 TaxID=2760705 RepID=UPI0020BEA466|nr:hypothetical protein [Nocardioides sp. InS609-2]